MNTAIFADIPAQGLRRQKHSIEARVRRVAEEEALQLHQRQRMTPAEIIHYYTGKLTAQADITDAIDTIVRFNMGVIEANVGHA